MRTIFYILCICLALISSSCTTTKVKFDCSNIVKIYIENRATHRYGGVKEVVISNKVQIADFCNKISSLHSQNNELTRPFKGTIQIEFIYKDQNNNEAIVSKYSTGIIFKENSNYFITNINGQFTDDNFLKNIKDLLQMH